jgi:hypothetical protein
VLGPVTLPQKTRHMLTPNKKLEDEGSWIE